MGSKVSTAVTGTMASVDKALDDMTKDIEKSKKQAEAEVRLGRW